MTKVAKVINRDATAVNRYLPWLQWLKYFDAIGQAVGEAQGRHQALEQVSNLGLCLLAQINNLFSILDPCLC